MDEREITVLTQILKESYSFDKVEGYGTGAILFRNAMIEFLTNGSVLIKGRQWPYRNVKDIIHALAVMNVIRPQAEYPLINKYYNRLNKLNKKKNGKSFVG